MTLTDARPRPRAFWADARFILGIVLIIGSIAAVWAVVAASRHTVPVLAAHRTIVPGEVIDIDDLQVADVALGLRAEAYLAPDDLRPGTVAVRTIGAGELVARASVGPADSARTTAVVIHTDDEVPAAVSVGAVVEVWAAPQTERGRFDAPHVLVADATVLSVSRADSVMGGGGTSLELVIPRTDVAATLAAVADESRLSVVPVAGTGR
jgi:hypothetical protein